MDHTYNKIEGVFDMFALSVVMNESEYALIVVVRKQALERVMGGIPREFPMHLAAYPLRLGHIMLASLDVQHEAHVSELLAANNVGALLAFLNAECANAELETLLQNSPSASIM